MSNTPTATPKVLSGIVAAIIALGFSFIAGYNNAQVSDIYGQATYDDLDEVTATSSSRPCAVIDRLGRDRELTDGGYVDGGAVAPETCDPVPTFEFRLTYLVPALRSPCKSPGEVECTPPMRAERTTSVDQKDAPEVAKTYQGFLGAFVAKHCPAPATPGVEAAQSPCPADRRQLGLSQLAWRPCAGEAIGAQTAPKGICVVGDVVGLVGQDGKPTQPARTVIPLAPADAKAFRDLVENRLR
jgi:hypothetical protein